MITFKLNRVGIFSAFGIGKESIPLEGGDEGDAVEANRFPIVAKGGLWPRLEKM